MNAITKNTVFLVGLGAPTSLYADYLTNLKKNLPQTSIHVLEWWNQADFGIETLQSFMDNSEVTLIGHSGGSVIALQAFAKWPTLVKKIIMIDSHFLHTRHSLPTVSQMLDIMLSNDNLTIQNQVKDAYMPIINDDLIFNKAFQFAIDWVNDYFDEVCSTLNTLPPHSVLQIGLTNSSYQKMSIIDKKSLITLWGKYHVDVECLPINHFDLIDTKCAAAINQLIIDWLCL